MCHAVTLLRAQCIFNIILYGSCAGNILRNSCKVRIIVCQSLKITHLYWWDGLYCCLFCRGYAMTQGEIRIFYLGDG